MRWQGFLLVIVIFIPAFFLGCSSPVLQGVNISVNLFPNIPDQENDNRWASHEEFLSGDHGRDCEDFALEKARWLLKLGYSLDRLQLWNVDSDLTDPTSHGVLVVDGVYVLDSASLFVYRVDEALYWNIVLWKMSFADEPQILDGLRFDERILFNPKPNLKLMPLPPVPTTP